MRGGLSAVALGALLATTGCGRSDLGVSGSRVVEAADGISYVDVRIDNEAKRRLDGSGEALSLNLFACDQGRDAATAHSLVSRAPVGSEAGAVWMRFSVYPAAKVRGGNRCGFLSSSGYSPGYFSSAEFPIR